MARPRPIVVLVILMSLAGLVYGVAWEDGGLGFENKYGPAGSFNSTMWAAPRPDIPNNCAGVSVTLFTSPAKNYSFQQLSGCINDTVPYCWAGVRDALTLNPFSPTNFVWLIPHVNFTLNQSCTLQLTSDGDLRLVISDMYFSGVAVHKLESGRVTWSSNTTGEGAVQVQLQNTGNLVLVNKDGKSVVWTSSTAPLLPLLPLNGASRSSSFRVWMLPSFSAACSSILLLASIGVQLFHGIF